MKKLLFISATLFSFASVFASDHRPGVLFIAGSIQGPNQTIDILCPTDVCNNILLRSKHQISSNYINAGDFNWIGKQAIQQVLKKRKKIKVGLLTEKSILKSLNPLTVSFSSSNLDAASATTTYGVPKIGEQVNLLTIDDLLPLTYLCAAMGGQGSNQLVPLSTRENTTTKGDFPWTNWAIDYDGNYADPNGNTTFDDPDGILNYVTELTCGESN